MKFRYNYKMFVSIIIVEIKVIHRYLSACPKDVKKTKMCNDFGQIDSN